MELKPLRNALALFIAALAIAVIAAPLAPAAKRDKSQPPAKKENPAPAASAPAPDPTPEQQAKIDSLLRFIESQPTGVIVNNRGVVAVPPGHRPYNPDGSRNQNFKVIPDTSQGETAAVLNHNKRRGEAVQELIAIGRPAVPQLVRALMTEGAQYRHLYAYALGEIKDPRAVPALIKYLDDGKMKFSAASSYRRLGEEAMAVQLEQEGQGMMSDAAGALQSITGETYGPDLARWQAWRQANQAQCGNLPLQLYSANPTP